LWISKKLLGKPSFHAGDTVENRPGFDACLTPAAVDRMIACFMIPSFSP